MNIKNNRITEQASNYHHLETRSSLELLQLINDEDAKIAAAVKVTIPMISQFIDDFVPKFIAGGRLFYIGAGTSGRLGILDASEIPPTYGLDYNRVIGIIAGGDDAIRKAVEFAEDDIEQGWKDLQRLNINQKDAVVGITASGTTPYVIGAVKMAKQHGIMTVGISNNPESTLSKLADYPLEAVVGPEFVTGSTRMKSGTAQKLILNMISTTLMIRIGKVEDNKMVNMQLSNNKLGDRGAKSLMENLQLDQKTAYQLLQQFGSVKEAMSNYKKVK
ncbi:MAG: N-acetylmuramic acid 6-phosphate etherase [Cyclobacteriaceae bacterium]